MLKSNSLFIDSEYKADCEHKINYFNSFSSNTLSSSAEVNASSLELLQALSDGVVKTVESYSYADDGTYVYPVRKITSGYSKIIVG